LNSPEFDRSGGCSIVPQRELASNSVFCHSKIDHLELGLRVALEIALDEWPPNSCMSLSDPPTAMMFLAQRVTNVRGSLWDEERLAESTDAKSLGRKRSGR
jgi:hypothetical protein